MDEPGNKRQHAVVVLLLALVTLAVYWPVTHFDFVNYDDPAYVTDNTHVQTGVTKEGVVWAFTTGEASNWHPLTWLSHMADCQLYGMKPGGHHLTSVLFHVANVLLLFGVFRQMTGALWRSAMLAALFAWHPLRVESVAWVSERKDVLSAFFWLLSTWAYVRYGEQSKVRSPKSKVSYILSLLFFSLGLMSKPMLVTLPFVLLLLDYWPLKRSAECGPPSLGSFDASRVRSAESKKLDGSQGQGVPWRRMVIEKTPFLALVMVSSVVTFEVQKRSGAVTSLGNLSVGARLANALVWYLRYVGKFLWPRNLSVLYPHPGSWPAWLVLAAALFLAGVTTGVCRSAWRRPYLFVGWFWFVGTLVPVIGLVQVGLQSMADRYTYIPGVGLLVMLCWGAPDLLAAWPERNRVLAFAGGTALLACLLLTAVQLRFWRDGRELFQHAVTVTRGNYLAYNNLGFFLDHQGKIDEALANYQKSIEINPRYEEAQNNMGYALAEKGRYAQAIPYYEAALSIRPGLAEAHNNLGNALSELGKIDASIAEYRKALELKPDHADAHNNLGIALAMQGRLDEAVSHLKEAIRLRPSYAGAHSNLGNAFAAQHKLDEAAAQYQLALQFQPDDAQAHNNLGNVLSEQGKFDEAIEQYTKALQLKADNPEANYNLGMVLLRRGRRDEALQHFREAVRLKPDYPEAQRQLSALSAAP